MKEVNKIEEKNYKIDCLNDQMTALNKSLSAKSDEIDQLKTDLFENSRRSDISITMASSSWFCIPQFQVYNYLNKIKKLPKKTFFIPIASPTHLTDQCQLGPVKNFASDHVTWFSEPLTRSALRNTVD